MSYTMRELEKLSGFSERSIRRFFARGYVPRPPPRGPATRYERTHLARLLALRPYAHQRIGLARFGAKLAAMRDDEVEALLAPAPAPAPASAPAPAPAPARAPALVGDRCTVVAIAPGLTLLVSDAATPFVRRVARRIQRRYAVGARAT